MRGENMKYTIDCGEEMALNPYPEDDAQAIIQNLYVIINSTRGTIPCYRDFGVDRTYLHKPKNIAQTMYAAAITEAVAKYEPRVKIDRVRFRDNEEDPAAFTPILEVTIK